MTFILFRVLTLNYSHFKILFKIKFFHAEWIEYLKRENKSENFYQIKNYYIQRKLKRFIQIDKKLLENKADDFLIVKTEKEFNEKCSQNQKNLHYLIQDEINQNIFYNLSFRNKNKLKLNYINQLKWQKSNGPISTLKKYLIMNKECEESIEEEVIFHKNNEKVLIISAEPGMGKSLILDHFTQNSSAENFFIKIILNTCTKTLSDKNFKEKLQNRKDDLIEFVLKSLLNKTNEQEILLLKQLAKEEKLILMFDGLDEVNDYKEQFIQLIDALNRYCKLKKILITTRNHLREELEDHFNTFSFNLDNFDSEDQKNFLAKYWGSLNLKNQENESKLMQSAQDLIERINSVPFKNLNQLIGIPLQTKILADIYFERVKNKEDFSNLILTNIAELYNEFIESKIKIQYEEKSKIEIHIDPDRFEEEKDRFFENHEKLSNLIFFENKNKKLENDLTEKEEKRIIKYGIIVAFKNGIPLFLHQSFAEFFLAKSCLQKIKEQNKEDQELKDILRDERHFLIRKFLNDLMENDEFGNENQEEVKKFGKEDFNEEIENCCRENLISLLKYFIQDERANLKTKNKFLIIACKNGHKDIVDFLLGKDIDVNQQDVDENSALSWASKKGHKEIVEMLLQNNNIQINKQDIDGTTALMMASFYGHKEIVQMLLQYKNNIEINHQASWDEYDFIRESYYGHIEIVEMLLQDKNIQINKQNKYGTTALMLASFHGHKEIVKMLLQNKNIQINQQDKYGATALMLASERGHKEIVQMLLQHKNIEINQQGGFSDFTALICASMNGYVEIVEMLLKDKNILINQQDKGGYTALMWAYANGHEEITRMLENENLKKNQTDNYGKTVLFTASEKGHKEIVQMLLQDKNIEINQQDENGHTGLMLASRGGHKEIVEILLQDKNIEINLQNNDGYTALMLASQNGYKEIVEILLQDKNIQINQQDDGGCNALMWASQKGHKEIVRMLLRDKNIEINQQDIYGWTALNRAAQSDRKEIVQILKAKEKDSKVE
jgi:ankyrin repeat protein